MLAAVDGDSRVVCFLSAEAGSGVSTFCRMLAKSYAEAGSKALLVDLSRPVAEVSPDDESWAPGDGVLQLIRRDEAGFDILSITPTSKTRQLFNNVEVLRKLFGEQLEGYGSVVVDLPPVLADSDRRLNPLAAARACDAVVMICMPNKVSRGHLSKAVTALNVAGVKLGGTIINDYHNPALGHQLASVARRVAKYSPRLGNWLERRLKDNEFLNSRT